MRNYDCFALISIPHAFGCVRNINERVKSNKRASRKDCKAARLCYVINALTGLLWILETTTCSIHTSAHLDITQTLSKGQPKSV